MAVGRGTLASWERKRRRVWISLLVAIFSDDFDALIGNANTMFEIELTKRGCVAESGYIRKKLGLEGQAEFLSIRMHRIKAGASFIAVVRGVISSLTPDVGNASGRIVQVFYF